MPTYRKSQEVDCEELESEVLLLNTKTLEVRLLNDLGAVLWDALDEYNNLESLAELLSEAKPETSYDENFKSITQFIDELVNSGYLLSENDN